MKRRKLRNRDRRWRQHETPTKCSTGFVILILDSYMDTSWYDLDFTYGQRHQKGAIDANKNDANSFEISEPSSHERHDCKATTNERMAVLPKISIDSDQRSDAGKNERRATCLLAIHVAQIQQRRQHQPPETPSNH